MRLPSEQARPARPAPRRVRRIWIGIAVGVVVIALLSLQGVANFYTDYLWYRAEHLSFVWRSIVEAKLGLAAVFVAAMFVVLWASLWFVDRMAPRLALFAPELELVRRYQSVVGPHVFAVRTAVSAVVAVAVGEGAAGQWQNWILFRHAQPFGVTDPIFGRDVSFFVFRLPFLSFLVNWALIALIVVFVVTTISHYLNGSIRLQGAGPRVDPIAVAHLSLILGAAALVKAIGYYYVQRFELEYSTRGVVQGANYTDVHVVLPALSLLAVIALVAFAVLAYNVYQRSIVLPAIALGLWAIVGIAVGIVYPALVQAFKVTPAQSTLELPYIKDNITATQYAYGLQPGDVSQRSFAASSTVTSAEAAPYEETLNDAVLWDPGATGTTFQKLQTERSYFDLSGLAVDRYGDTPYVIGVRTLDTQGIASPSWVNTHLQYTHGYGLVLSPANAATSDGDPNFSISDLPPQISSGSTGDLTLPANEQAYFGMQSTNYVVVDSGQAEIDYTPSNGSGSPTTSSYDPELAGGGGSGAVPLGSFWTKAAFALRFHDLNLLISKLVTPSSQIIFVQSVEQMVQKAAPFLQVDTNPYPVLSGGSIYWIVDAYTESSWFPYSQAADTSGLSSGSGLQGNYNYVRNSVKVVINAYTGAMQFYVVDASDPLIEAYSEAFPGLFKQISSLQASDPDLLLHLRYPQDFLELQATMYGRYHVPASQAATFYNQAAAWEVAQTPGTGSPSSSLPTGANGATQRFQPVYEELQLGSPSDAPEFDLVEPMVPYSVNDRLQTLSGFLVATSDYNDYGQLTMYTVGQGVSGPALINSEINANQSIATEISLLDQHGSTVTTGTVLLLPVDGALIYVRPIYVSSSQNPFPQLRLVVVVYGNTVAAAPTLQDALSDVFGAPVPGVGVGSNGQPSGATVASVRALIVSAARWSMLAQQALHAKGGPDLAAYQSDETEANALLQEAAKMLSSSKPSSSKPSSSTSSTGGSGAGASGAGKGSGSSTPAAGGTRSGSGSGGSGTTGSGAGGTTGTGTTGTGTTGSDA